LRFALFGYDFVQQNASFLLFYWGFCFSFKEEGLAVAAVNITASKVSKMPRPIGHRRHRRHMHIRKSSYMVYAGALVALALAIDDRLGAARDAASMGCKMRGGPTRAKIHNAHEHKR
jgi:fermentation-respiration switch protein FrsA (DUF1100 family)